MRYLLICLLFTSCATVAPLPTHQPEKNIFDVTVHVHSSKETILVAHPKHLTVRGFQYFIGNVCHVHYIKGDYEALAHEVAHCMYGQFHEEAF